MIDLHIPALMRKLGYSLSGKLLLSDAVRNFAYQWAGWFLRTCLKKAGYAISAPATAFFPPFWRGGVLRLTL